MAWEGSDRRARLPADWHRRRRRIIRRDGGQCTALDSEGNRCELPGTDVDHIVPGDDHSDDNLRLLCGWHHKHKSAHEGGTAAAKTRVRSARPPATHPALED
jgi:5-methylcytosine-specific restriction enzyme A